jgi:sulfatase maturation enzyme AslB (radical SAM superfamily)
MFVYEIEVSNVCSLTCIYCPHPTQARRKGFMSFETFRKCIELYKRCENREPLCLHNFGEVLLHPKLPSYIRYASDQRVTVRFFTNGLTPKKIPYTRKYWQHLADQGLREVHFSAHELPLEQFQTIVDGVVRIRKTFDPLTSVIGTWAGQVGASDEPLVEPCLFERRNAFVVLWDGRISACCIDAEGQRQGLTVDDLLRTQTYDFERIPLCGGCKAMREGEDM